MPTTSGFQHLGGDREPSALQLAAVVDAHYSNNVDIIGMGENDGGVAFAGLGEPTLRLGVMLETVRLVKERRHGVKFRLISNGLVDEDPVAVAEALHAGGVRSASIALMTANPQQYAELMRPLNPALSHSTVCNFIVALSEAGVETEATVVKSPGVNVRDAKHLAEALGAVNFREREFFC